MSQRATAQRPQQKRVFRFKTHFTNTIYDVMKSRGYRQTDSEVDWDIHWSDVAWIREVFDSLHLGEHQRVNHFRNHYELTRKDLLIKNVKRMRRQLEKEDRKEEAEKLASVCPLSFVLPHEYSLFAEEFKRNPGVYIMKPIGRAQGRGIFLFNRLSQISDWKNTRWRDCIAENYVVQKYIENPYLVGGKKFDLRIYVLVTSFNPLVAYMYREGFARFTFHRFSLNPRDLDNNYVHLTNVAIQKTSNQYDEQGCKWHIRMLKMFLISRHGHSAVEQLFRKIQELVLLSLFSVQRVMIQDKHCFELYGYDIIIDENLKPWILEVNASPSLTADTESDYTIKTHLLDDMLTVIDLEKRLTGDEVQIGGFDLICRGKVRIDNPVTTPSNLGSFNDRDRVLRRIYRQAQRQQQQQQQQQQQLQPKNLSDGRRQAIMNNKR